MIITSAMRDPNAPSIATAVGESLTAVETGILGTLPQANLSVFVIAYFYITLLLFKTRLPGINTQYFRRCVIAKKSISRSAHDLDLFNISQFGEEAALVGKHNTIQDYEYARFDRRCISFRADAAQIDTLLVSRIT